MYDAIIIGAGMSGLAAGIRLAHFEQKVCILEKHYTIGGLNSFYRLAGRDYDVGLHAVTNFTPKGAKTGPLARLLRQLRFKWEDFELRGQVGSRVTFPDVTLRFNNDFELFKSEVHRHFPEQKDNFERLLERMTSYDDLDQENYSLPTRATLAELIDDPLLIEMILCPLMWYGNAREEDMDWGQFCIMFRSIFMEGMGRPRAGVRSILKNLVKRFRELGGELKLRSGVERIELEGTRAVGVVLDNGEQLSAKRILSSAGWMETMRLCRQEQQVPAEHVGQMSFVESSSVLNVQPTELGHDDTIVFFCDRNEFPWRVPTGLCDLHTGVICSPNNFLYEASDGDPLEGTMRVTTVANFARWQGLEESAYQLEKLRWYDKIVQSAVRFVPDYRGHTVATDVFTPKTIRRFTWHDNGAVYGSTVKRLDGATPLENLYLCGTDQGFAGIIGAIFSGISIANRYCLHAE
jgi:phytoene dehydrogenase-like protein